jgi:hypothetical protein
MDRPPEAFQLEGILPGQDSAGLKKLSGSVEIVTGDIRIFSPELRVPYADTWQAGVTRQIGRNMAIEARYLGARSADNAMAEAMLESGKTLRADCLLYAIGRRVERRQVVRSHQPVVVVLAAGTRVVDQGVGVGDERDDGAVELRGEAVVAQP